MTKKKTAYSSVVIIDNHNNRDHLFKDDTLIPLKKLPINSNYFYTTCISNKDMIISPIEVVDDINGDDLEGMLEDRAYEELGLDDTKEHIIHYMGVESKDSRKKIFQLFVIEKDKYIDLFGSLKEKIKYIDLIIPAPLLYQSLYNFGMIHSEGVQAFLYFTHNDTFITFYKNGKYLYSKSIPYSLDRIYDIVCEMSNETVDEGKFFKTLQKDGLKNLQSDIQQNLIKLFGDIFISINDILIYTKRAYDLEAIEQIYSGSEIGVIPGLDEHIQNYLGFHSIPLEFDFDIQTEEKHTDQLHYLMVAVSREYMDCPENMTNFTIYPRPPSFFRRPTGQIAALVMIIFMIAMVLPAYHYISARMNDAQTRRLNEKEKFLAKDVARYKHILKKKKMEYDEITSIIKGLSERFSTKEKTLRKIHDKKVNYRLKSDQLILLGRDLLDYDVKANAIYSDLDTYSISLVSHSDKTITKLIKEISKKYFGDISSIDIKKIEKDKNSTFYNGILKVKLK